MIPQNYSANDAHLYIPQVEPALHYSEPRRPISKRMVSSNYVKRPRLTAFAEHVNAMQLPERWSTSKFNTLEDWRNELYVSTYRHGDFSRHMTRSFLDACKTSNAVDALRAIEEANQRLMINGKSAAMSDEQIVQLAASKSIEFTRTIKSIPNDKSGCNPSMIHRLWVATSLLASFGLSFRKGLIKQKNSKGELFSLVNRVCDEIFLRRLFRQKFTYMVEQVARDLALVQRSKQVYCSDFSVTRQRERRASNQIALENTVAYDENNLDNWFTIAELADKSVSNPDIRRGEMFVRLRGFEEFAQENGHAAVFYTSTCPSRFHSVSKGVVNQKWLDAGKPTANQAHDYLLGIWQALGKVLSKKQIKVYGMRIVEPHQDGTPHHHYLLFVLPEHRDIVTTEFNRLALKDSPNEKGAKKHRFTSEVINWSQGSAVGYVAKYLSKNIDGKHIDSDKGSSLSGIDAAERVVTWARVSRINQFQFFGGPSVTAWRQMRRIRDEFKEDDAVLSDLSETEHFLLEKIRKAADIGDWKDFCYAMGGVFVKRTDQPVRVHYNAPDAIEKLIQSGEFSPTRYGDTAQARISGVMFRDVFLCTRFRNWQTENKDKFLAAQGRIMSGVVDYFDALEAEQEYERMCEKRYQEYEDAVMYREELEALMLYGDSNECAGWAQPARHTH